MVTACLCLSLNRGVKIVAIASILLGIGVTGVSSWILHRAMQARKNPTLTHAHELLHQANTFFGGTAGLYDLDVIFRILIACSSAALCGGFLQFLMSFWLLLASVKGGRIMARIWVVIHIIIMMAIGGGCLCILTNELEITTNLEIFLITTGADFFFLIYFCWVVFSYSYSLNGSNEKPIIGYHVPSGNVNVKGSNVTGGGNGNVNGVNNGVNVYGKPALV